jgi:uncharacterized protein YndB with AHSA1/START domain
MPMAKFKFTTEYEFQASPKILFEYISTPVGLSQWFCDKAVEAASHHWNLYWDETNHPAVQTHNKPWKLVRFQFDVVDSEENVDPAYLQFEIDKSELTRAAFLRITDYSEMNNRQELEELWDNLIGNLKSLIREK